MFEQCCAYTPFPECHLSEIVPCVAFRGWHLPLSSTPWDLSMWLCGSVVHASVE